MKYALAILAILVMGMVQTADAQQEQPALLVTDGGYYYIVLDDNGVPSVVEVDKVIDFRGDTPDPPTPPDPPDDPEPPNSLAQQVEDWADQVNHPEGAQALSTVYSMVAENVADGSISVDNAFPAIKQSTDQVLDEVGGADQWQPFRDNLGDYIVGELQQGNLGTVDEMSSFLDDVATGLENSAGDAAIDPEVITAIIELIMRIIDLFGNDDGGSGNPI